MDATAYAGLNWANFLLGNLLPVTLGNIVGGGVFVGAFYWLIYRQPGTAEEPRAAREFHAASIAERRVADVSRAVGAED